MTLIVIMVPQIEIHILYTRFKRIELTFRVLNPFVVKYKCMQTAMAEAFLKWGDSKLMTRFSAPTTRAGTGLVRNFKRGA